MNCVLAQLKEMTPKKKPRDCRPSASILIAMVGEIGQRHKEDHRTQQGARKAHLYLECSERYHVPGGVLSYPATYPRNIVNDKDDQIRYNKCVT